VFKGRIISTLKHERVTLSALGLIVSVSFLSTCASTNELSNNNIVLPDINSLSFETIDKPKIGLQTPVGTKQVYDPIQDPDVIAAFEGLVKARQRSGYFKGWPKSLAKRGDPLFLPEKSKTTWKEFRQNNPNVDEYNKVIGLAKIAQYNDYQRAGCSGIGSKICREHSFRFPRYEFGPCSESQTNWGGYLRSECEEETLVHFDVLAISQTRKYINNSSLTAEDICVNPSHVGDPKRGSVRDQFEAFFEISCGKS